MAGVQGDARVAVFSGVVERSDARGHPVTVTRWFQRDGIDVPRVWLDPRSFGDGGGDCTTTALPIGTEWIFITSRQEGLYTAGACAPHARLSTAEGQAMRAEAVATFGQGRPPATAPPAVVSLPPSPPPPRAAPEALGSIAVGVISVVALVLGVEVLVGLIGVLRRSREKPDEPG